MGIAGRKRTWIYLFTGMAAVILVAMAAITAVSLYALRRTAHQQTEDNLRQFCFAVAHFLDAEPERLESASLRKFCESLGADPDFRITYISADGTVIADSNADPNALENHRRRPEVAAALAGQEGSSVRFSESLGRRLVYYAIPHGPNVIRLAVSVGYVDTESRNIAFVLVIASVLILFATLGVSLLVARRLSVPLSVLEKAAHSYAEGQLNIRLNDAKFPKEFADLATTFSLMSAKLREKIDALDGQNRETEAILASMNDALLVLSREGTVVRANRAAEALFSVTEQSVIGKPLIQAVRNTDVVDFALSPAENETERTVELRASERDGARYALARTNVIPGNGDKLLVLSDVTRLKKLERIRKDFVANVSHELKTPVTSIQGFIETLKDGALDDKDAALRFLDIMDQQSHRLTEIIRDLLTISRLEQGERAVIAREPTDVAALFENVRNLCAEEAAKKRTKLRFECPAMPPCEVNAGLIEQAVTNLALNAIKYSPEKATVKVSATFARNDSTGSNRLILKVEDNGIGIPDKDLSRIFERFYRVDKGRSRDLGGTGLGLSIVRHIALAHGGSVSVESVEGEGSVFTIDIPA